MGGGELKQEVILVLLKDFLDGVFPTFEQFLLRFCSPIHVMSFISNQNNLMLAKISIGDGIFFKRGEVRMKLLDSRKTNIDVVGIDAFEIRN